MAAIVASQLFAIIQSLADDHGIGILLVEQHVDLALSISDRAYVLDPGWIVATDTATAIRADKGVLEWAYPGPRTS